MENQGRACRDSPGLRPATTESSRRTEIPSAARTTFSSSTFNVGPAPPIPPILRLRKVRTDFFDRTPIAEVEVDQLLLNRMAPLTVFSLEASSNLRDWEFLKYVGLLPLAPVTFTDHVAPAVTARAYRLRR